MEQGSISAGETIELLTKKLASLRKKRDAIDAEEAELLKDLEAVKRVQSRGYLGCLPPGLPDGEESDSDGRVDWGQLRDAIEQIIGDLEPGRTFGPKDIFENLAAIDPTLPTVTKDSSVSGCLRRLAKEKLISVVTQGVGKRPPVYMKPVKETLGGEGSA